MKAPGRTACAAALVLVAGCGEIVKNAPDGPGPTDAPVADAEPDAALPDAPPSCDPLGTFSAPVALAGLASSLSEQNGSLAPDELSIYVSGRLTSPDSEDIYVATRGSLASDFGALAPLPINSTAAEVEPSISPDGLTLWFVSSRGGSRLIYQTTRVDPAGAFGEVTAFLDIQAENASDRTPFMTADSQELWFSSNRQAVGGLDIWHTRRSGTGFEAPVVSGELFSTVDDTAPVLSADKLTIYVSSNRDGGAGGFDIWRAQRTTTSDSFGPLKLVSELNTELDDYVTWVSPDGCRVYLQSARVGRSTTDIFVASR